MSDTNPPKPPRRSRTRTEVEADFGALGTPQALSEKEKEQKALRAAAARQAVLGKTAEKAAADLAGASVSMQKSLAAVQEELTTKLAELETVQEAVRVETEELTRLYGAETVQSHLDVLIAQHNEKKTALEKEIADLKAHWEREKADTAVARQREHEHYTYQLGQQRKVETDAHLEEVRKARLAEQIRYEQFEKQIKEREALMAGLEQEFQTMEAAVANHPAELDKAVKQAVGIETSRLTREHTHEKQLWERDSNTVKALADSDKRALTEQVQRLTTLNQELQLALKEANAKNVEIANKALDAAGDKAAFQALQTFTKDQANGGTAKRS